MHWPSPKTSEDVSVLILNPLRKVYAENIYPAIVLAGEVDQGVYTGTSPRMVQKIN